jgi:hypothetical protein
MGFAETKWTVLGLAVAASAVIVLGSIGVVRLNNQDRQLSPAIIDAANSLSVIPDSLAMAAGIGSDFTLRRDAFARQLLQGELSVDSARAFYQAYALWRRDGDWDLDDIRQLAPFLGLTPSDPL